MKKMVKLIFPHQLFLESPILDHGDEVYLIEEFLFFKQYAFHKQKIAFHRASMKYYEHYLIKAGHSVNYIQAQEDIADIRMFLSKMKEEGLEEIKVIDPIDNWLVKRIHEHAEGINIEIVESPSFLNTNQDLNHFFNAEKQSFFQTTFYKQERKKRKILLDESDEPLGGKWTFDTENRKKYPKGKTPPSIYYPETDSFWEEAKAYTEKYFQNNPGAISEKPLFPYTHQSAEKWFQQFLDFRFHEFGAYEDAIVKDQSILHHSVLSPMLNNGLLLPNKVLNEALHYSLEAKIPLNSTEGFVRQIIGWREFIRGMYVCKGSYSRTQNFWKFTRKIPPCFYDGSTGIVPVDETIKQVLKTGYCHHIERLMILGNFMLLCEFDPDEVYRWFMELFIDAYDWVMVPNIYGMSQFADGGTFATKPYIGASNYIRKMSNYPSGEWEAIWDGLFWRFIHEHQEFFKSNPRMSMMYYSFEKMSEEKKQAHLQNSLKFLEGLAS